MEEFYCYACGAVLTEQNATPSVLKRRRGYCQSCSSIKNKKWRKDNPEQAKQNHDNWIKEHPERAKAASRTRMQRYRASHPDYVQRENERLKEWFKENPDYQRLWREENRDKVKGYEKKANELNPSARADRTRKCKYGVDREQFDAMIDAQRGVCAICKNPFVKTPCVDHDHLTGQNRDLLCHDCNHGIGNFKDDPDTLRNAILYIYKHSLVQIKLEIINPQQLCFDFS